MSLDPEAGARPSGGRTAILILGMHRSGTSALTRTISLLGADLPRNLMPAVEGNNEAGFWESLDVYHLNDEILASLGAAWDDWLRVHPGRLDAGERLHYESRAVATLEREFGRSSCFVLKDPRICRLLPLWIPVLESVGAAPVSIIPLRNPLEVVASLQRRDGFDAGKSLLLWLRHVLDAEYGSRGRARVFVTYDGMLNDPRGTVARITRALGVTWPTPLETAEPAIAAFLQQRHRHHAIPGDRLPSGSAVAGWAAAAYLALIDLQSNPRLVPAMQRLDRLRGELDRADDALGDLFRSERDAQRELVLASASRVSQLEQTRADLEDQVETLQRSLRQDRARVDELARDLAAHAATIASTQSRLALVQQENLALVDLKNRLLHRLNAIQLSAAWQLGRPLRAVEAKWPRFTAHAAGGIRLLWWCASRRLSRRLALRRQAKRLTESGLFSVSWYVEQYPRVVLSGTNPMLDWLIDGWREGRDPHPLFDTAWYLARHPGCEPKDINPVLHYLDTGWKRGCSPHPLFDPAWYLDEHPALRDADINPFLHYLQAGAAAGWDPNPLFDTDTYVAANEGACSRSTALEHFARSGRDFAPGAYRDSTVLVALQHDYRARTMTRLVRDERRGENRTAVLLQCGRGSLHEKWLSGADQDWDLIVNHYDPTYRGRIACQVELAQQGSLPGTKFTAVDAILADWPGLLERYDYLFLLDDDIELTEADISALFATATRHGLDLTQPSLSPDSYGCHPVFRTTGRSGLRAVNGVEIMMPVVSRRALHLGRALFGQTISGWGLDVALAKLVGSRLGGHAAVVDEIVVRHSKPIDLTGGAYYRMLSQANIFPLLEYRLLRRLYDADAGFFVLPGRQADVPGDAVQAANPEPPPVRP